MLSPLIGRFEKSRIHFSLTFIEYKVASNKREDGKIGIPLYCVQEDFRIPTRLKIEKEENKEHAGVFSSSSSYFFHPFVFPSLH